MRYRASKALDESTETTPCDLIPTKLATAVWNLISQYKSSIPNFPQKETCELLILDRSVDQVLIYCPVLASSFFFFFSCMILYFDFLNVLGSHA